MSNSRYKLIAMILTLGMFTTGCEMDLKAVGESIKDRYQIPDLFPSASADSDPPTEETNDTIEEFIPTVTDPTTGTIYDVIEPTQQPSTPETETTNPETEETAPELEETIPETTQPEETEPIVTEPEETIPPIYLDTKDIMVTANTKVNLRAGNSTDSEIIGSLELGDSAIKLLSIDAKWDLVKTNEQIAYVHRDYVDYTEEQYEDEYEHEIKNDIVLTTSELNLRAEPTANSKQLTRFQRGAELEVVAEVDNGWLLVQCNNQLGYVDSTYTKSLLQIAQEQYPELELDQLGIEKVVYSNTTLNIRNGNSTEHECLGQLEKFETVRVLGEYDEWYFILTNDYQLGFVKAEYTRDLEGTFVIVDKSEQQLWLYENDQLILTTPVTTGKDSTPSDTGKFKIYSKETDRYLTDGKTYNVHVDYWMPYNGGEGLHDASWRGTFGTESYHSGGSHGCINIPPKVTPKIFEKVKVGDCVIVHK